jgi:hypothetical protein
MGGRCCGSRDIVCTIMAELPARTVIRTVIMCAGGAALACLSACTAPSGAPSAPNAPHKATTANAATVPVRLATEAPPPTTGARFPVVTPSPGWRRIPGPAVDGGYDAVTATGPDDAWAAGSEGGTGAPPDYGHPVIVHWNGTRWTRMDLPASTRELTGFTSVAATSAANVWAAGGSAGSARYFVYHFDGVRWTGVPLPPVADINAPVAGMAVTQDGHVWVVGTGGRGPFFLRWDGAAWTELSVPRMQPVGIVARTSTDVWVTGSIGQMYHWDGKRWTRAATPASQTGSVPHMIALAADDVWAVGGAGGGNLYANANPVQGIGMHFTRPHSAVLHWNGRAWRWVALPRSVGPLTGIAPDGAGGVWITAASDQPGSLYLHWRAGRWTRVYASPPPSPGAEEDPAVAEIPGSLQVWSVGAGGPDGGNIELFTP